jgi:hypothetical protein
VSHRAAATAEAARPIARDVAEMRFRCEAPGGALIASLAAPKTSIPANLMHPKCTLSLVSGDCQRDKD